MKLFKYEGYKITIEPEALMLKPFKAIWDRDKSKDKSVAMQELAYIYFMEDPRSDYQIFIDRNTRDEQIREGQGLGKWKADDVVKTAQEFYASFKTQSALFLEDIRAAVITLRKAMITQEELDAADPEKKPKMLNDYAGVVSKLSDLVVKVDETEKKIAREITISDKVRGSVEKAALEDDF